MPHDLYNKLQDLVDQAALLTSNPHTILARAHSTPQNLCQEIQMPQKRRSISVLEECVQLQTKKSADYQNPNSTVEQADYYPRGVWSLYDIMHTKMTRIKSLLEAVEAGHTPNFEGLDDSARDLINYSSFFVSWLDGQIPGQSSDRDMFNKPKNTKEQ